MKITCPDCDTSYEIKAELVGTEGRSVKCARCGNRWFISPRKETLAEARPAAKPVAAKATAARDEDEEDADWSAAEPAASKAAGDDWATAEDEEGSDPDAWSDQEKETDVNRRSAAATSAAEPADDDADFDAFAAELAAGSEEASARPADAFAGQLDDAGSDDDVQAPRTVDIESLAKRKKIKVNPNKMKKRRDWSKLRRYFNAQTMRRAGGLMILLLSIGLGGWLLINRNVVVRQAPDLASLFEVIGYEVNLRGLEFRDLRTFREIEGGTAVLVVEGTIQNVSETAVAVPAVRLALRGEDQQEIYAWTLVPRAVALEAQTSTRFRTRLADPPETAADIQVRFVDRTRQQAALQNQ